MVLVLLANEILIRVEGTAEGTEVWGSLLGCVLCRCGCRHLAWISFTVTSVAVRATTTLDTARTKSTMSNKTPFEFELTAQCRQSKEVHHTN